MCLLKMYLLDNTFGANSIYEYTFCETICSYMFYENIVFVLASAYVIPELKQNSSMRCSSYQFFEQNHFERDTRTNVKLLSFFLDKGILLLKSFKHYTRPLHS